MKRNEWAAHGPLAASLLALELVAGIQTYVLATIVPLVGAELSATQYYGALTGSVQVGLFFGLPLGPYLSRRFGIGTVVLWATIGTVLASLACATAQSLCQFIAGRLVSGLSGGIISTVSLTAIVIYLPKSWRRAVLAGYNLMWVITSLVGPSYSSSVAAAIGWRWCLLLYLPILLTARKVMVRSLKRLRIEQHDSDLPWRSVLLMSGGVAMIAGSAAFDSNWLLLLGTAVIGAILLLSGGRPLFPTGTLFASRGRPAAVAMLGHLCLVYFGIVSILPIVVHDLLGESTADVAAVLTAGGLSWALAALYTAKYPAEFGRKSTVRTWIGSLTLFAGSLILASTIMLRGYPVPLVWLALSGSGMAGIGMGLLYIDAIGRIVEYPENQDSMSKVETTAAVVIVENVAASIGATFATALLGAAIAESLGRSSALWCFLACGSASLLLPAIAARTRLS